MSLLSTPAVDLGMKAPDFKLLGVSGRQYSLSDVRGPKGLVVMFICNHCPYVKGIISRLPGYVHTLQDNGIGVVAIMPNDTDSYPEDSFENMKTFAARHDFTFPYLLDETQKVAQAYGAVCTPDFFGFDGRLTLQYRGRLDSAGREAATTHTVPELENAMLAIASGRPAPAEQLPSMGCSIKWK